MSSQIKDRCVVSLSGGQDSTTVLFWAKSNFKEVEAVTFDYGQKHDRELQSATTVAHFAKVKLTTLSMEALSKIGGGGLTNKEMKLIGQHPFFPSLPASFVPLRNLILLSTAAAYAIDRGIDNLATGVCQTDYSGYPDCRRPFIDSLEICIQLAVDKIGGFTIHTPLMELTKSESVILATKLEGCMDALSYTHTCYNNNFPPCGMCPACVLREKGFKEAGVKDPLMERADKIFPPKGGQR